MMRRLSAIAVFLLSSCAAQVDGAGPVYVLAIGNNAVPQGGPEGLKPLQYADDDAAAFCSFAAHLTDEIVLLEVPDDETQRRFPEATRRARPPTMKELDLAVQGLASRIERDRREGKEPVLILFYSGHGFIHEEKGAALALLDAPLTSTYLYDRILGKIPATYVHLLVDACHAEALVRPRGEEISARVAALTEEDRRAWVYGKTLARFPHVGVVMATAVDQQAHEWDTYRQGVFTHEVLSGLRGAADVNVDRKVEYSELHAFLAAANREVKDPRGRLEVQVMPPAVNRRVPLVDLSVCKGSGRIVGLPTGLGHFYIEDEHGNRLVDLHAESGFQFLLTLPSRLTLFLRSGRGEASFRLGDGERKNLSRLALSAPDTAPRGSVTTALRRGLFTTPFGPAYYRGFADRSGAIPVPLADASATVVERKRPRRSKAPAMVAWAGAGVMLATAAVSGALALDAKADWERASYQRQASEAADRYDTCRIIFYVSSASAVAAAVAGALLHPWNDESGRESPMSIGPTISSGRVGVTLRISW